jgi:hypothetical protein
MCRCFLFFWRPNDCERVPWNSDAPRRRLRLHAYFQLSILQPILCWSFEMEMTSDSKHPANQQLSTVAAAANAEMERHRRQVRYEQARCSLIGMIQQPAVERKHTLRLRIL